MYQNDKQKNHAAKVHGCIGKQCEPRAIGTERNRHELSEMMTRVCFCVYILSEDGFCDSCINVSD